MKWIILTTIIGLLLIGGASALSLTISPPQDYSFEVEKQYCSSDQVPVNFQVTNKGIYGMLCWYYVNDNIATRQKLTYSCLDKSQGMQSFSAWIPRPDTETKIQLECYDFGQLIGGDKCPTVQNMSYNDAYNSGYLYSGGVPYVAPRYATISCSGVSFSLSANPTSQSLYNGESKPTIISINNLSPGNASCVYQEDGGAQIPISGSSFTITTTAPESGSGSIETNIIVTCTDNSQGGVFDDETIILTASYQPNPVITNFNTAITVAENSISSAQSEISKAQAQISSAEEGVNTASAENYLNQANSLIDTARTQLDSAKSTQSQSEAVNANNSALNAKQNATNALDAINLAIEAFEKEQKRLAEEAKAKEEQERLEQQECEDNANKAYTEAENSIETTKREIEEAKNIAIENNIDTVLANTTLESAQKDLNNAEYYLGKAYSEEDCDFRLSLSNDAKEYAEKSATEARSAAEQFPLPNFLANALTTRLETVDLQVKQTNETYINLTKVVRGMRKYSDVSTTLSEIESEKVKIDIAKDYYSEAQNLKSLEPKRGLEQLLEAQNGLDSTQNKMDRITENLKYDVVDALQKEVEAVETKIQSVEGTVSNAVESYGTDASNIISAQDALEDARISFGSAQKDAESVEDEVDLALFLEKSASAFDSLSNASTKLDNTVEEVEQAGSGALAGLLGGTIGILALGGGGYLFYRHKKSKAKKDEHKKKEKK